jgi:hypothetical protein
MKNDIWELRRALIRSKQISRRDLRELRYLSQGNHEQRVAVMQALGDRSPIKLRMHGCGSVDDWNNVQYCKVPLCPRCFMRERRVQTCQAIRGTFLGAANEDLAFVTVLLPVTEHLSDVSTFIEKEKRRLINFVGRQQRMDVRWSDFLMVGWWELDRMSGADFERCGRNTKLALTALEFPILACDDTTIWRPHFHAIIRKGKLSTDEIAKALRNDGRGAPYQVDVRPFNAARPVNRNLQSIVRYCLKFRIEEGFKGDVFEDETGLPDTDEIRDRTWWPDKDIKAYAQWLCETRSGFQSMRFVLGRKQAITNRGNSTIKPHGAIDDKTDDLDSTRSHIEYDVADVVNKDYHLPNDEMSYSQSQDSMRYNNVVLDTNWIRDLTHEGYTEDGCRKNVSSAANQWCDPSSPVIPLKDLVRSLVQSHRIGSGASGLH